MIKTIREQSCQDYHLIIVDDQSTDGVTPDIAKSLTPDKFVEMNRKGLSSGARNEGMNYYKSDKYTLWFDDDDILIDVDALKKIKECAKENNYPDIIRFNWIATKLSTGLRGKHHDRFPQIETVGNIAQEIFGGMPWTKAVKTEKVVEFPEDLIVDDCFQHIMQCDELETAAVIHDDLYEWLVRNGSVTTSKVNPFRESGWYLEIAKLMRAREIVKHDYTRKAIDARINFIKRRHIKI